MESSTTHSVPHSPVLALSDVVHDSPSSQSPFQYQSSPSPSTTTPSILFTAPKGQDNHPHLNFLSTSQDNDPAINVDILEHQLNTFLNHNATVTHPSTNAFHHTSHGHDVRSPTHSPRAVHQSLQQPALPMSDLDFNDLAAMLQAVAAEENASKDKTRAAPAFHSLTADDPRIISPRVNDAQTALSDDSRFLYGSDTHSDNQDGDSPQPCKRQRLTSDEHELPPTSGVQNDFSDISDILNHLVHFEHPHTSLSTGQDAREANDIVEQVYRRLLARIRLSWVLANILLLCGTQNINSRIGTPHRSASIRPSRRSITCARPIFQHSLQPRHLLFGPRNQSYLQVNQ
ncbi:hypothetical protein BJV78DRAFT_300798 [Lactifluus subvellereus]|nr:hypothetical protein BJV78DRAFT_300798 [Lactifluus subvellereus]